MPKTVAKPSIRALDWMAVGKRPAEVDAWRLARLARIQRDSSRTAGIVVGGICGFVAVLVVPGAFAWPLGEFAALFLGVGVPLGVGEFYFNRWMLARRDRIRNTEVTRVAVSDRTLFVETDAGEVFDVPLRVCYITRNPVAAHWYAVSTVERGHSRAFFVPGAVASQLVSAKR